MKKKTAPPCNEDCFNCIYPDCIYDGLGRETKAADDKPKDLSQMSRSMRYYYLHQEEQCAHKRAYYAEHREEINARRRKPPKEAKVDYKGLCASCKHFINRSRGKRGGLWGICDKSSKDCREYAEWGFLRPVGFRNKCSKYEEEK